MQNIHFHFKYKKFPFRKRTFLKEFILDLFNCERQKLEGVSVIFCDDLFLNKLNKEFLRHDTLTDILTFRFSEIKEAVTGEIYISVERVKENAGVFRTPFALELHRVIFHGILHLCNYTDATAAEKGIMRGKEDYYLQKYFGL